VQSERDFSAPFARALHKRLQTRRGIRRPSISRFAARFAARLLSAISRRDSITTRGAHVAPVPKFRSRVRVRESREIERGDHSRMIGALCDTLRRANDRRTAIYLPSHPCVPLPSGTTMFASTPENIDDGCDGRARKRGMRRESPLTGYARSFARYVSARGGGSRRRRRRRRRRRHGGSGDGDDGKNNTTAPLPRRVSSNYAGHARHQSGYSHTRARDA